MIVTTAHCPDIECEGCANAIKKAIGSQPGVQLVSVDIAGQTVTVQHDDSVPADKIMQALDDAGFPGS